MPSARMAKISDLMISEISKTLLRKVKDPRVKHVTVTDVEVTRDLKQATVYFSVLMDNLDKEEVLDGLNHAAGFIRSELFHRLRMKYIPKLVFKIDPSIEYGAHMQKILHAIQEGKSPDEE
jgi:ribosome-binding factor A